MKKVFFLLIVSLCIGVWHSPVQAQAEEAQQLLLDVEKLTQLKQILQGLKTGYQIISTGYNTIKSISEGNFTLHQDFLNSLLEVSPAVRKYKKIKDIISCQQQIINQYKTAYRGFKASHHFSPPELEYIGTVYSNLLRQSFKNVDELAAVLTSGKLRMSDDERLHAIDKMWEDMQEKQSFLQHFNTSTGLLALQRDREQNEVHTIESLYGITQ